MAVEPTVALLGARLVGEVNRPMIADLARRFGFTRCSQER
jgi:hypothetical protein